MATDSKETLDTYWVSEGLLAGEYPGSLDEGSAKAKLQWLVDAGITCIIDLTEEGEHHLKPYAHLLVDNEDAIEVEHVRMAIRDLSVPTRSGMNDILDIIDDRTGQGQSVYVHCMGGIGRTGTVVGCYLVRHGIAVGNNVMPKVAQLRDESRKRYIESPEMPCQKDMVKSWRIGE